MDLSTSCGSADMGEPGQRRDVMIESRAPFSARPGNQNSPLYPKLSRRQEVSLPLLQVFELNVKARADNSTLVQPARQIDHNLALAVLLEEGSLKLNLRVTTYGLPDSDDLLYSNNFSISSAHL